MVKGCKKNVVFLKNTNSDIFDIAYFVLRDGAEEHDGNIIDEANRILEENCFSTSKKRKRVLGNALCFIFGMLVSAAIIIPIML